MSFIKAAEAALCPPPPIPLAAPVPAPHSGLNGSGDADLAAWADAALRAEVEAVATASEGTRNDRLNVAAYNLGQIVAGGQLSPEVVIDNLTAAARHAGLTGREVAATIASGLAAGVKSPRYGPATPRRIDTLTDLSTFDGREAAGAFWASREVLAHIHTYARARMTPPYAVLAVVLARVVAATSHHVVLPPTVGTQASLNLFVALVARSGGGKGISVGCGREAVTVRGVEAFSAGSGEGLAHLYARHTRAGVERVREAVLLDIAEIDTLAALGERRGATLLPELRKAWSGERLGFAYADPKKALPIEEHSYRLCLLAGVQPGRAQWVLDDAAGGTPQRFAWFPAADPGAPEDLPACPEPWDWSPAVDRPRVDPLSGRWQIAVCPVAVELIRDTRRAQNRGEADALDGHALLTRLKLAAALAILDRRWEVTESDWDLSGHLAAVSDATRAGVVEHLRAEAKVRNIGRADAEAERAIAVTGRQEADALQRACAYALRRLRAEPDGLTGGELSRGTGGTVRGALDEALDALVETGQIVATEVIGGGTSGLRWKVKK